ACTHKSQRSSMSALPPEADIRQRIEHAALCHKRTLAKIADAEQHGWHSYSDREDRGGDENSNAEKAVGAIAPANCANTNAGMPVGCIPANKSVSPRASVTAGFAKLVDAVNQ